MEEVFRFKKFEIKQNELVHKVGTDGVLLGAWIELNDARTICDIGTGTGVISLMLSQRSSVKTEIIAIEPDENAYQLAKINFKKNQTSISILKHKIQDWQTDKMFDLIVCNPPYFINSLKSPLSQRTIQRHADQLNFSHIIDFCNNHLTNNGRLGIVLPTTEGHEFKELALSEGYNTLRECCVFSKEGKAQERFLFEFSKKASPTSISSLTIMDTKGNWTKEYIDLTKEFYLKF